MTRIDGNLDTASVRSDGTSVVPVIDGVVTNRPVTHVDERGALFEIYNGDDTLGTEPVVYVYQSSVYPGHIKGWNRHVHKTDRYTILHGEAVVLLYDDRPESPTSGMSQRVALSPRAHRQLVIPKGVWHLFFCSTQEEAHLLNMPTVAYHHDAPDRVVLPWDTEQIPVDVRKYLPKF